MASFVDSKRVRAEWLLGLLPAALALGCGAEQPGSQEETTQDSTALQSSVAPAAPATNSGKPIIPTRVSRLSTEEGRRWHDAVKKSPMPSEGCFRVEYPSTNWHPVPCSTKEPREVGRSPNRHSARAVILPQAVGNTTDDEALVPGLLTDVTGEFPVVSGVSSENDGTGNDHWTLQINSNRFANSNYCANARVPAECSGWQQFIFENLGQAGSDGNVFMQYWLVGYNQCPFTGSCPPSKDCPSSKWHKSDDGASCFRNSQMVSAGAVGVANLSTAMFEANTDGTDDTVVIFDEAAGVGNGVSAAANVLTLHTFWNSAEFNLFGDGEGRDAVFNSGSTLTPSMTLLYGGNAAPACVMESETLETNSLTLIPFSCCTNPGALPEIIPTLTFKESNVGGFAPFCWSRDVAPTLSGLL